MAAERDELLEHFQRELGFLRRAGVDFARTYPKIAARLELGPDGSADPHVERLIESFAYLTGRVQRNLDAEFPRLTEALFQILYPQLAAPIPAMGIARFELDPAKAGASAGETVERGTALFALSEDGNRCRFQSAYPVTFWPVTVAEADIRGTDRYEFLDHDTAAAVLRLKLTGPADGFLGLAGRKLRFYLSGEPVGALAALELLRTAADRVAFCTPDGKVRVRPIDEALHPVGFEEQESVLPYPEHAHPAYRLLQEYFVFPDKFRFLDLAFPVDIPATEEVEVLFLLTYAPSRGLSISPELFALGCTPIINLFTKTAEPLRLDRRRSEYRVVPDGRLDRVTEVHSITSVIGNALTGDKRSEYRPYFSIDHAWENGETNSYWSARRVPTDRREAPGSDIWLSFVDLDLQPQEPAERTIMVTCLCTNRLLAEQVPTGALLQIEQPAPVTRILVETRPTQPRQPALGGDTAWRLVSHLSLNYLSMSAGAERRNIGGKDIDRKAAEAADREERELGLKALQEILRLHAPSLDAASEKQIQGIRDLRVERVTRRVVNRGRAAVARGLGVTMDVDERQFVGGSAFLLGSVVERFLGLYAGVNAFTQLTLTSQQRSGNWFKWPTRIGDKPLV
ncbi:type VI secretion system baseplate subunit TssF [Lacibacterium aquatile]|uniref:Type VI secretion system baseplate subunit TssF n=1 Tax=Lacibacterium aquatile TaxID=1168082 RepID=A0ABW5DTT8_9PROT